MPRYIARGVDDQIASLMRGAAAVMVLGPRTCGKTTSAARHARSIVRLDLPSDAFAFTADPDTALAAMDGPVLLDEWQAVPGVLGAVKRAVDADPAPGQFLLTGSARAMMDSPVWPGTGRVITLPMFGLTEAEIEHNPTPPFLDRLMTGNPELGRVAEDTLVTYVERAMRGSFPPLANPGTGESFRSSWLASYIDHVVHRDAAMSAGRDPVRFRRYLEAYALNTAGVVAEATIVQAAAIDRGTARLYESLLEDLFLVAALPSWRSNRLKRLVAAPKRHLVDPALLAGLFGLNSRTVLRDGNLLGRVLESFVVAQIRVEAARLGPRVRLFHLRAEGGHHEVDVLIEHDVDSVIGLEVKATASPALDDASHLLWLRDNLGDRFTCGVILHTGPWALELADRVYALPISSLWRS